MKHPLVISLFILYNCFQDVCDLLKTFISKLAQERENCEVPTTMVIEILMIGFRKSPQPAGLILFKEVI